MLIATSSQLGLVKRVSQWLSQTWGENACQAYDRKHFLVVCNGTQDYRAFEFGEWNPAIYDDEGVTCQFESRKATILVVPPISGNTHTSHFDLHRPTVTAGVFEISECTR